MQVLVGRWRCFCAFSSISSGHGLPGEQENLAAGNDETSLDSKVDSDHDGMITSPFHNFAVARTKGFAGR